jgi:alpha-galactosidase
MLEFCRDIREVAEPGALLLNYANPMAMMTWAAIDHGKVHTVGLWPRRAERHRQIARALKVPMDELGDRMLRDQPPDLVRRPAPQTGRKIARTSSSAAFERHPAFSSRRRSASTS